MSRSRYDPEIVYGIDSIGNAEGICEQSLQFFYEGIAGDYRIHVGYELDVQRLLHHTFDIVYHVVALKQVAVGVHLDVYGCEDLAGAVVVHHQIVYPQDSRFAFDGVTDGFHQMSVGGFSQQRTGSFSYQLYAGPDYEKCHQAAHPSVDLYSGDPADDSADKYSSGGDHIVAAVRSCSHQCNGIDLPADAYIEQGLPELHQDRSRQDDQRKPAEIHGIRMYDLACGGLQQLHADDHYEYRYEKSRQIFYTRVSIGVSLVFRQGRQPEPHQGHY